MQSHRNTSGRQRLKCYNLQSRAQEMEQRVKPGTDVETPKRGFQKVQRTLQEEIMQTKNGKGEEEPRGDITGPFPQTTMPWAVGKGKEDAALRCSF